jgi:hypothetical protein
MSIAIQKQLNQEIISLTASDIELSWAEFVDKIAGDNDHLLAYLPLLKAIPAIETPFELMVQFNTLRGQFANSEEKMANLLAESDFIDGQDYCLIDVENEKFSETLMFISYNCLKLFVMDKNDLQMTRAMVLGEQMYSMYKDYSKKFTKVALTSKTHYMIVEQKKISGIAIKAYAKSLGEPEKIILLVVGNAATMKKTMDAINESPSEWGDIIVPVTKAIYANAKDDIKRIVDHVIASVVKPYKDSVRMRIKADAKAKNDKDLKAPTSSDGWGCIVRVNCMIISSNNKTITFTHDEVTQCIKEHFVYMLAQKHMNISKLSHDEYLECITDLEAKREQSPGRFSAIRANAIYFNQLTEAKKAEAKADAKIKKDQKDATKLNGEEIQAHLAPTTSNGYETTGSDGEKESKPDPIVADKKKDAKAKSTKTKSAKAVVASDDETKPEPIVADKKKDAKAKSTKTKSAKAVVASDDETKPEKAKPVRSSSKRGSKIEITTKPEAKPKTVEIMPSSESEAEEEVDEDDVVSDVYDEEEVDNVSIASDSE